MRTLEAVVCVVVIIVAAFAAGAIIGRERSSAPPAPVTITHDVPSGPPPIVTVTAPAKP